jgi:hypothetical protein
MVGSDIHKPAFCNFSSLQSSCSALWPQFKYPRTCHLYDELYLLNVETREDRSERLEIKYSLFGVYLVGSLCSPIRNLTCSYLSSFVRLYWDAMACTAQVKRPRKATSHSQKTKQIFWTTGNSVLHELLDRVMNADVIEEGTIGSDSRQD